MFFKKYRYPQNIVKDPQISSRNYVLKLPKNA